MNKRRKKMWTMLILLLSLLFTLSACGGEAESADGSVSQERKGNGSLSQDQKETEDSSLSQEQADQSAASNDVQNSAPFPVGT